MTKSKTLPEPFDPISTNIVAASPWFARSDNQAERIVIRLFKLNEYSVHREGCISGVSSFYWGRYFSWDPEIGVKSHRNALQLAWLCFRERATSLLDDYIH